MAHHLMVVALVDMVLRRIEAARHSYVWVWAMSSIKLLFLLIVSRPCLSEVLLVGGIVGCLLLAWLHHLHHLYRPST
jgi:hypothetical protein